MSAEIKLESPDIVQQIARFAKYDQISDKHFGQAMKSSLITLKSNIKRETPVGVSSRLRGSIDSEMTVTPISIIGKVGSTLNEAYPSVINNGRTSGWFPPPAALERWVQRKLGVSAQQAPGVAYLVARKISRSGIKGQHFMEKGYEASKYKIDMYFDRAQDRVVKELVDG